MVFEGRVISVVDGATATVLTQSNTEFQVRCKGIKAPENERAFAARSGQRLADLLIDEAVTVRDAQRDSDGAIVGTILWNGRDICLEQINAGMARYDDASELRRVTTQRYSEAESEARSKGIGLWGLNAVPTVGTQQIQTPSDNVRGHFKKNGTYVPGYKQTAVPSGNGFAGSPKKQSRWITALKWIGVGAALAALMYVDARYVTPSSPTRIGTPMAKCKDGSYSYSQHRQGTCSHHGGVAYWFR